MKHIGSTGNWYADYSLPGGSIKIDPVALAWFPARSIARERFFAGKLPSLLEETRSERRRERPTRKRERGGVSLPCKETRSRLILPLEDEVTSRSPVGRRGGASSSREETRRGLVALFQHGETDGTAR
ncbi:hypothetical protein BHE74_00045838 [Ensete ventricosum]|nr:hypothetical protein BHE74_00045838 [Ensete ventricosum]